MSVLVGCGLAAIGPATDLIVHNAVVSPDGFSRSASIAGDSVTGPLIVAQKGDRLKVNVINNLDDPTMFQSTSIHWHGFFQKEHNWADGGAFVNQCPIAKGHEFLYDYPTDGQTGTFWYHSHLSTQYCDGVRGAIVVYDPSDPFKDMYDVDDEGTVITLADWYHTPSTRLELPDHDSVLINGLGRYKDGPRSQLAVVQVEQGKRYRMRVINIGCQPDFEFYIDKHAMTVIEADSVSHQPVETEGFRIFAGQRYSYILQANQPVGNYWIRSEPTKGRGGFKNGINSAILRYVGAPASEPGDSKWKPSKWLDERDLHPLENPGAPGEPVRGGVDHAINFDFSTSSNEFMINDVKFEPPSLPVLLQVLSGAFPPDQLLPKGSVYPLPKNATIEITMTGAGKKGWEHPIHLHGHAFDVVRVAGSDTYNYQNPVRRDVVNSGKGGDEVTIRFVTDNPGPWFIHCHIDWHLETGFAAVLAEAPDQWNSTIQPPPAWQELCPIYASLAPGDL
ncbi:laccase, multicopper oxidase, benzenediol:oxygen oxidorectuctase [Marasmius crinis-equi]|uniref:Laccase, multicopper oxidase, benzenediol:oxygen oxidorectuctase n=1 Tax=Marasmius crinis-equi TaxID=585013 RepID=A0ABR3FMN5_9AGAR